MEQVGIRQEVGLEGEALQCRHLYQAGPVQTSQVGYQQPWGRVGPGQVNVSHPIKYQGHRA